VWAVGSPDNDITRIAVKYTGGAASGSISLTIPGAAAAGTYEIRLFANDSWTRLDRKSVVKGTAAAAALSATPATVTAGTDVTGTWSGIAVHTSTVWVGVWAVGSPDNDITRIAVKYTGGAASGSISLTIPGAAAAGTYEIRLFANDSWTR